MDDEQIVQTEKQSSPKIHKSRSKLLICWYAILTLIGVVTAFTIVVYVLRFCGLESMLILFVVISAAIWGWVIHWLYKDGRLTMSHILVIWMVWTGTVLGGASYYLSYIGKTANLETLSRYIMVEVVAGVGGYFVKSGIENVVSGKCKSKQDEQSSDVPKDLF